MPRHYNQIGARGAPSALSVALVAALLIAGACDHGDAPVAGPAGRDDFQRYYALGTGLSMGEQSGGVIHESQQQAWPALLAHMAGAEFDLPLLRSPGCSPPLVAPLQTGRWLSGASTEGRDSSCAGTGLSAWSRLRKTRPWSTGAGWKRARTGWPE